MQRASAARISLCVLGIALGGCALANDSAEKDKCNTLADCLNGYTCLQGRCVTETVDTGLVLFADGGSPPKTDKGTPADTGPGLDPFAQDFLGHWREVVTDKRDTGTLLRDTQLFLYAENGALKGQIQRYNLPLPGSGTTEPSPTFLGHNKLFNIKTRVTATQHPYQITFGSAGSDGGCFTLALSEEGVEGSTREKMLRGDLSQCPYFGVTPSWIRNVSFSYVGPLKRCSGLCPGEFCDMSSGVCTSSCATTPLLAEEDCEEDCLSDKDCPRFMKGPPECVGCPPSDAGPTISQKTCRQAASTCYRPCKDRTCAVGHCINGFCGVSEDQFR